MVNRKREGRLIDLISKAPSWILKLQKKRWKGSLPREDEKSNMVA